MQLLQWSYWPSVALGWYFVRQPADHDTLVLFGNVDIRQVSLAFNGSERVAEMRVQEGDRVEAGQVIARLDIRALTLQIAEAQARIAVQEQVLLRLKNGTRPEEVAQTRAEVRRRSGRSGSCRTATRPRLREIEQNFRRTGGQRAGYRQCALPAAASPWRSWKTARRLCSWPGSVRGVEDIAEAAAQLNVARAELDLLNYHLSQAELKAPINATVRSRLLEPGDMASPERPVYALAITDPKWVRAYITEVDLGRIKPGMSASVTIDSHPDEPIPGRVGYISSVAEFTPKTVQTEELRTSLVYEVRVYVDDPGDRLRLGMPATVRIPLEGKQFSREQRRWLRTQAALIGSGLHKRFLVKETGQTIHAVTDVSLEVLAGNAHRLGRPGRGGQNHTAADDGGADDADEGRLEVLGIDVAADPQAVQDRISYMPQRFGLYEDLSVQENLDLYADLHGVTQAARKERYRRLLHMTNLARFTSRPAGKLSGGMKQKLGLACTLVRVSRVAAAG